MEAVFDKLLLFAGRSVNAHSRPKPNLLLNSEEKLSFLSVSPPPELKNSQRNVLIHSLAAELHYSSSALQSKHETMNVYSVLTGKNEFNLPSLSVWCTALFPHSVICSKCEMCIVGVGFMLCS